MLRLTIQDYSSIENAATVSAFSNSGLRFLNEESTFYKCYITANNKSNEISIRADIDPKICIERLWIGCDPGSLVEKRTDLIVNF